MLNMKSVIQNHKINLLSKQKAPVTTCSCSCRKKSQYSLSNKCLSKSPVFKAVFSQTLSKINKCYYVTCGKTFKEWHDNHTATFRKKSKQKSTELSKYIWELKQNSIQYQIRGDIASRARTQKCDLCMTEKLTRAKTDPCSLLSTRDEFNSKCKHMSKLSLKCFKIRQW